MEKTLGVDRCIYCGGSDLVCGIHLGVTAEARDVGLSFTKIFTGTEPLYADLCTGCGSISRLHIHNPDRKWVVRKPKA